MNRSIFFFFSPKITQSFSALSRKSLKRPLLFPETYQPSSAFSISCSIVLLPFSKSFNRLQSFPKTTQSSSLFLTSQSIILNLSPQTTQSSSVLPHELLNHYQLSFKNRPIVLCISSMTTQLFSVSSHELSIILIFLPRATQSSLTFLTSRSIVINLAQQSLNCSHSCSRAAQS